MGERDLDGKDMVTLAEEYLFGYPKAIADAIDDYLRLLRENPNYESSRNNAIQIFTSPFPQAEEITDEQFYTAIHKVEEFRHGQYSHIQTIEELFIVVAPLYYSLGIVAIKSIKPFLFGGVGWRGREEAYEDSTLCNGQRVSLCVSIINRGNDKEQSVVRIKIGSNDNGPSSLLSIDLPSAYRGGKDIFGLTWSPGVSKYAPGEPLYMNRLGPNFDISNYITHLQNGVATLLDAGDE